MGEKTNFEGIELPMSCEEAVQEASRCLRCDRHGCGTTERRQRVRMVNLTINNKKIQVPEGTTILAAAAQPNQDSDIVLFERNQMRSEHAVSA